MSEKKPLVIQVKVTPNAAKNEVIGWEGDFLKIRLRALPEKGEANEALVKFLSEVLLIPKSHISLTRGHSSRLKQLFLSGISKEDFLQKVEACKKV